MPALGAGFLAGLSWIAVLSSLNVSAQLSLPDWVRARGLAVYNAVFFGSMTLGSVTWGQVAAQVGIPLALAIAAGGALLGIAVTRGFRLQSDSELDLAPSSHWPQPLVAGDVPHDAGPVMVTVEYRIDLAQADSFRAAMAGVERERRRNGAFSWGLYQDAAEPARFLEYFIEDSWLEHLRHHERVTRADRDLQAEVHQFHIGPEPPRVSHYTGDGLTTARVVASRLGIDEVHGEVKPADKLALVQSLQAEGRVVAMAGDGINDAPALAKADVGIAMGTGTDVAMSSAQVTLVKGDLRGIAHARAISEATVVNMKQNLGFAFVYNALGVPLAAGLLYPFTGWLLSPMVAALAMSLSSASVVANALRLRASVTR